MAPLDGKRRWLRWVLGGALVLVVLAVAVPFVYIHFIQGPPPKKLALAPEPAPSGAALSEQQLDGTWKVGAGSQAGYRVKEVLAGQNNTAVGRGTGVTGSFRISGDAITAGSFAVELSSVTSDSAQRDSQFNGRIMNTAQFPTASFRLTTPVQIGRLPAAGEVFNVVAHGVLTMHGVGKAVTVPMQARDDGATISVTGEIPVTFADWGIANPSFGSFVKTENSGLVEFLLTTTKS
jgi:polyisoprenoid-binding protein YceI